MRNTKLDLLRELLDDLCDASNTYCNANRSLVAIRDAFEAGNASIEYLASIESYRERKFADYKQARKDIIALFD